MPNVKRFGHLLMSFYSTAQAGHMCENHPHTVVPGRFLKFFQISGDFFPSIRCFDTEEKKKSDKRDRRRGRE